MHLFILISHCLLIWGATPKTNLQKLQQIQNNAVRLLAGANWQDHAPPSSIYRLAYSIKYFEFR